VTSGYAGRVRRRFLIASLAASVLAVTGAASAPATEVEHAAVGHESSAQRAYLLCADRGARERHRRFQPRTCNTLRPRQPFAAAVNLVRLRWRHWGAARATARGIERGFHRPATNIAVRVRAYRRRQGCRGDWIYTRLRVSSRHGHTIVRQPTGCR